MTASCCWSLASGHRNAVLSEQQHQTLVAWHNPMDTSRAQYPANSLIMRRRNYFRPTINAMQKHTSFPILTALLVALLPLSLFAQFPSGGVGGRPAGAGANPEQFNIGRFYGKVIDEATGEPLAYASVQLIGMQFDTVTRKMEEKMISGQLTRDNGEFSLEKLPIRGEYTLKINYLSYASFEKKVSFGLGGGGKPNANGGNPGAMAGAVDKDLGNIKLGASSKILQEVQVLGEASRVTLALDKKVYRVDKDNELPVEQRKTPLKMCPRSMWTSTAT